MAQLRLEEIRKIRLQKIKDLKEKGNNPYKSWSGKGKTTIVLALGMLGKEIVVAGRLWGIREHGNSVFADLKDETGKIQLFFQKDNLKEVFKTLELIDLGDFIWAKGKVVKTKAGEVTVDVDDFGLLTK